jgi:hypothetical protein
MAEPEHRRAEVWRQPQERLRSLMSRAVEDMALLVESGDDDTSIELLKITGMYRGLANHIGELVSTLFEAPLRDVYDYRGFLEMRDGRRIGKAAITLVCDASLEAYEDADDEGF